MKTKAKISNVNVQEIIFITLSAAFITWMVIYLNVFVPQFVMSELTSSIYNADLRTLSAGSTDTKMALGTGATHVPHTYLLTANVSDGVFMEFSEPTLFNAFERYVVPIAFMSLILAAWALFAVQMHSMARARVPVEKRQGMLSWEKQ